MSVSTKKLAGKVAVVTGASKGIGAGIAKQLAADGAAVVDGKAGAADFLATVCELMGIDHGKQNETPTGRPIRIVDKAGTPVAEALA